MSLQLCLRGAVRFSVVGGADRVRWRWIDSRALCIGLECVFEYARLSTGNSTRGAAGEEIVRGDRSAIQRISKPQSFQEKEEIQTTQTTTRHAKHISLTPFKNTSLFLNVFERSLGILNARYSTVGGVTSFALTTKPVCNVGRRSALAKYDSPVRSRLSLCEVVEAEIQQAEDAAVSTDAPQPSTSEPKKRRKKKKKKPKSPSSKDMPLTHDSEEENACLLL